MKIKSVLMFFLCFILLFNSIGINGAFSATEEKNYLIELKKEKNVEKFLEKKEVKNKKVKKLKSSKNLIVMQLKSNEVQEIQNLSEVEFIEEDSLVELTSKGEVDKNQPDVKNMKKNEENITWGMKEIGLDFALNKKFDGKKIKIAVIDTGISNHPDLKVSGGVTYVEGTTSFKDDNGHGTHVAGTIAALHNKIGVVGAASKSDIYAVKVLNKNGSGSISQVIQGIEWAIENQMNIISMSLGSTQYSRALHEVIIDANKNGILVIAAAGNSGNRENSLLYPAQYPEVLSVGATDKNHSRANFSSTGPELDVVAPGVDILSTTSDGEYGVLSGTSMATPHVTGAAATIWSQDSNLTNEDVIHKLIQTATPLGEQNEYGHGIINLAKALGIIDYSIVTPVGDTNQPNPPSEPIGIFDIFKFDRSILTLSTQLNLLKEQALLTNNIELAKNIESKYNDLIVRNAALHTIPEEYSSGGKDDTSIETVINDFHSSNYSSYMKLKNEYEELITYYSSKIQSISGQDVSISAFDRVGDGQSIYRGQSATVSLKLAAPKDNVYINVYNSSGTKITGTTYTNRPANTPISYTWGTSTSTPVDTYTIQYTYSGTPIVDTFTIYVTAPAPSSPSGLYAYPFSNSIILHWSPVSGATSYVLKKDGVNVGSTTGTSYEFTGLSPNNSYELSVAASNSGGWSSFTPIGVSTQSEVPGTPTGLSYTATSSSIILSWNGDSRASSYTLQRNGITVGTTSSTSYPFEGLSSSSTYTLGVAASNSSGSSSYAPISATTSAYVPTIPETPTVTSTSSYNDITLSWSPVNGATNYTLRRDGMTVGTTTGNSYKFEGLTPGTSYTLGVASTNSGGSSTFNSKSYSTLAIPAPTNLATMETDTSITLSWSDVSDAISYSLQINDEPIKTTTSSSYTFRDLTPSTSYTLKVAVTTPQGTSSFASKSAITQPRVMQVITANIPIDVSLPKGDYQVYKFTPTSTGVYKLLTGPYGGIASSNDTVLELYSDPNLKNQIAYNDDSNGTLYSEIKLNLNAGITYYVKLRHFLPTSGVVHARLMATLDIPPTIIDINQPDDVDLPLSGFKIYKFTPSTSGSYKVSTSYYQGKSSFGSSDTVLYVYSDPNLTTQISYDNDSNGNLFSKTNIDMVVGKNYYIKLAGFNNKAIKTRFLINPETINYEDVRILETKDIDKPSGQNAIYRFNPSSNGYYRFFTYDYKGEGIENDTTISLYSDSQFNNLLSSNDNFQGPYGNLFSKVELFLEVGKPIYIKISSTTSSGLYTSFAIELDDDALKGSAKDAKWEEIIPGELSSKYDIDYYKIVLSENKEIHLNLNVNRVSIEDENGNLYGIFRPDEFETFNLVPKTYYAKVEYDPDDGSINSSSISTLGTSYSLTHKQSDVEIIDGYIDDSQPTIPDDGGTQTPIDPTPPDEGVTPTPVDPNPIVPTPIEPPIEQSSVLAAQSTSIKIVDAENGNKAVKLSWKYLKAHSNSIINVYNNKNDLIYQKTLGYRSAGINTFNWNGRCNIYYQYCQNYYTNDGEISDRYYASNGLYRAEIIPMDSSSIYPARFNNIGIINGKPTITDILPPPPTKLKNGTNITLANAGYWKQCVECTNYFLKNIYDPAQSGGQWNQYGDWARATYYSNGLKYWWYTHNGWQYSVANNKDEFDNLQELISLGGFIPVVGPGIDGLNAVIYLVRGQQANAALAAISLIPFYGDIAGGSYKVMGARGIKVLTKENPCNCFAAGTLIATESGKVPIENIKIGDKVLAQNTENGETDYKPVESLFSKTVEEIYKINVGDEVIETTNSHPFWVKDKGWVLAEELTIGDLLTDSKGQQLSILDIQILKEAQQVYNFSVAEYHTYYITEKEILVHNTSCFPVGIYRKLIDPVFSKVIGTVTGSNSKILGEQLTKAGFSKPDEYGNINFQAHHIVPVTGKSGDSNVTELHNIFKAHNIDINSASNGVWLPSVKGVSLVELMENGEAKIVTNHSGRHVKSYYAYVYQVLNPIKSDKTLVLEALQDLREQLLKGEIKLSNLNK
jgi:subtilisin family serine protease/flagellar hook assembly protein FlgD